MLITQYITEISNTLSDMWESKGIENKYIQLHRQWAYMHLRTHGGICKFTNKVILDIFYIKAACEMLRFCLLCWAQ